MRLLALLTLALAGCAQQLAAPDFPEPFTAEFEEAVAAHVEAMIAGLEARIREHARTGRGPAAPTYAGGDARV